MGLDDEMDTFLNSIPLVCYLAKIFGQIFSVAEIPVHSINNDLIYKVFRLVLCYEIDMMVKRESNLTRFAIKKGGKSLGTES